MHFIGTARNTRKELYGMTIKGHSAGNWPLVVHLNAQGEKQMLYMQSPQEKY